MDIIYATLEAQLKCRPPYLWSAKFQRWPQGYKIFFTGTIIYNTKQNAFTWEHLSYKTTPLCNFCNWSISLLAGISTHLLCLALLVGVHNPVWVSFMKDDKMSFHPSLVFITDDVIIYLGCSSTSPLPSLQPPVYFRGHMWGCGHWKGSTTVSLAFS